MNQERAYGLAGILFAVAAATFAFVGESAMMTVFVALAVVFLALSRRG